MLAPAFRRAAVRAKPSLLTPFRTVSTLSNNPHIVSEPASSPMAHEHSPGHGQKANSNQHVFPDKQALASSHILSLLPTSPPTRELAIGTTTAVPPTPDSFTENPKFLDILQSVLRQHAHADPMVQAQALAYASSAGSFGVFLPQQRKKGGDGAGGANLQGGAGGGGRGGWVHVSDLRNPPDYGRIAWPEDIFGSLEVDSAGQFVDGHGNYQPSGTYRIVTREGM